MASGWQKKLARVSRMDWDEVRTRVGQELQKRGDVLLYRLGRGQRPPQILPSAPRTPHFFFEPQEVAGRAELVGQHLPSEAGEIVRQADQSCEHRFDLLGYQNLDYGKEIDWHLDRVHGKRAPLEPWFRIPFLDFHSVGDHKVTWELNRHQHLVTLAKAALLTGDKKYTRELVVQWRSWTEANPYPLGINWASTLEVAFRSLSWIWVDQLLRGDSGDDVVSLRNDLLPAIAFHGRYIERFLSTYFSPNTHLLGEAVALFFIGTIYPQIADAARWQRAGWEIVLREAQRQVRPDGVYFEQSLYYHVYALDFFLHARLLAERNGAPVPAEFEAVLKRMLDVIEQLAQAGPTEGFGDDDGGRLFNPRRNRTEHMTDPLAIKKLLYADGPLAAASLTEEAIWLFGSATSNLPNAVARPRAGSAAFTDGGLYVLADCDPFTQQMVVDAGPQGIGHSGHGHADALSLRLTMDGRRWLVDSGSGVYISAETADRNAFRGTAAHNTLRVDDAEQAVPEGPFGWSAIPTTRAEKWTVGRTFSYFAGSHDGYSRLSDPVTHQRQVVKINGGPWLVRDIASGQREHGLELLWHFAADLELRNTGDAIVAAPKSARASSGNEPALVMVMPANRAWAAKLTRGLLSPAYGAYEPAPVLRCAARVQLPAEIATALLPCVSAQPSTATLASMRPAAVQAYELTEPEQSHGFCFALERRNWSFGPWASNAEFLYCRIRKERLAHLIVSGGTYVSWQGQQLLTAASAADFEWREQDAAPEAGPFAISPLFAEITADLSSRYAEKH